MKSELQKLLTEEQYQKLTTMVDENIIMEWNQIILEHIEEGCSEYNYEVQSHFGFGDVLDLYNGDVKGEEFMKSDLVMSNLNNESEEKEMKLEIGNGYSISLAALYEDGINKLRFGYEIKKSSDEDNNMFYDLFDLQENRTLCFDGESCLLENITEFGDYLFGNYNDSIITHFKLTQEEVNHAIFQSNKNKEREEKEMRQSKVTGEFIITSPHK